MANNKAAAKGPKAPQEVKPVVEIKGVAVVEKSPEEVLEKEQEEVTEKLSSVKEEVKWVKGVTAPTKLESAPVKTQKIRILEPVDCIVGGISYKFDKDKTVDVPTDVAAILTFSRQAYRL